MHNKFLAIVRTTFIEAVRQPVYSILLWTAALWLGLFGPALSAFSLEGGGDSKVLKDIGLSTLMLYGLLCGAFSAAGVVTREIESFSALTVISKPVSRPLFITGKFFGVAVAVLMGLYILTLVFLMTVRQGVFEMVTDKWDQPVLYLGLGATLISLIVAGFGNFFYGWHFGAVLDFMMLPTGTAATIAVLCFDKTWTLQDPLVDLSTNLLPVIYGAIMVACAVLLLTAFAVAFSTRMTQVMTLLLTVSVFLVGLLSDYYFGTRTDAGLLFNFLHHALPNFQFFWIGDALTQGQSIPFLQVQLVLAYTGLYTAAVLALAVILFQTREVG